MSSTTLPLFITLILYLSTTSLATTNSSLSAYDVLQSYDFPVGLLPSGVTGYEINTETDAFKVYMPKTCTFNIESYGLKYKNMITGTITKDRLYNLKGVTVKILFLWFNIVEVRKDDNELQFSVGIASANFPLVGFEESPTCGCGFDCNTASKEELNEVSDHDVEDRLVSDS